MKIRTWMLVYILLVVICICECSCATAWAKEMYKHRGPYTRVYDTNRYYDSTGWHHD